MTNTCKYEEKEKEESENGTQNVLNKAGHKQGTAVIISATNWRKRARMTIFPSPCSDIEILTH